MFINQRASWNLPRRHKVTSGLSLSFCVSGGGGVGWGGRRKTKQNKWPQSNIDPDRMTRYLAITLESVSVTFPSDGGEHHSATGGDSGAGGGREQLRRRRSRLSPPDMHSKARPAGGVIAAISLREFTSGLSNIVSGNLPD